MYSQQTTVCHEDEGISLTSNGDGNGRPLCLWPLWVQEMLRVVASPHPYSRDVCRISHCVWEDWWWSCLAFGRSKIGRKHPAQQNKGRLVRGLWKLAVLRTCKWVLNLTSACEHKSWLCPRTQQWWRMRFSTTEWCASHSNTIKTAKLSHFNKFGKLKGKWPSSLEFSLWTQYCTFFTAQNKLLLTESFVLDPRFKCPCVREGVVQSLAQLPFIVPADPKLLLACKGFSAPGHPTGGFSCGRVAAPMWVAVVTTKTCSTDEACRGVALLVLVILTGCLGAGSGTRHGRCFVPQFGLSGLEVLAKTLGRIVNGGTSQVKDVAGQVLAKAGLQKSWHLFPLVYGYTPCW